MPTAASFRLPASRRPARSASSRISLAEWSLHKALFAKKIDNLEFPRIAKEDEGIEGVEFVNQFFKDSSGRIPAYLKDLKEAGG